MVTEPDRKCHYEYPARYCKRQDGCSKEPSESMLQKEAGYQVCEARTSGIMQCSGSIGLYNYGRVHKAREGKLPLMAA